VEKKTARPVTSPVVDARGRIAKALAGAFDVARERMSDAISRLARTTAPYRTADTAAGAVRALAAATQLATGPGTALAIAAVSGASIAAIASYAAVRALGDAPSEQRRHALAYVIARVEDEELCDPLLAETWRFAIGARPRAFRTELTGTAVRMAAGAALTRGARKSALAKISKVAMLVDLVRAPERARKAHRLVARARHHARAFAASIAARAETAV
jgi:hypothetical protein